MPAQSFDDVLFVPADFTINDVANNQLDTAPFDNTVIPAATALTVNFENSTDDEPTGYRVDSLVAFTSGPNSGAGVTGGPVVEESVIAELVEPVLDELPSGLAVRSFTREDAPACRRPRGPRARTCADALRLPQPERRHATRRASDAFDRHRLPPHALPRLRACWTMSRRVWNACTFASNERAAVIMSTISSTTLTLGILT